MDPDEPYYSSAEGYIPETGELRELQQASRSCQACHLWCHATQTVFGEGNPRPDLMLIGEQPGDKEDIAGHPFVGPAGKVLDRCLDAAGVDKQNLYTTNAVKHFKFEARSNRRLHKKPNRAEMNACRPWLEAEIRILRPKAIICLGATAAQSLLGPDFKVTLHRGEFLSVGYASIFSVTVHPSSLLRLPDRSKKEEEERKFIADLSAVVQRLGSQERAASA